jgi:hypothetical protein
MRGLLLLSVSSGPWLYQHQHSQPVNNSIREREREVLNPS